MDKQIIGVVGLGLIGGSMCKALIKSGHIVVGMDADKTTEDYAKLAGIIDDKLTDERVGKCDYIFIALYPQATVDYLRAHASQIKPGAVVMDLCGVKRAVCAPCFELAKQYGFNYIGGHPMAGRQFSGLKYSTDDMFVNATMVMVTKEDEDLYVLGRTRELLRDAGFKADMDHTGRSLKAQFKYANKMGATLTATLGDEEIASGVVKVKNMATKEEQTIALDNIADGIRNMLASSN